MPHNLRSLLLICTLFLASLTAQRLNAAPLILRVGGAGAFKLPDKNATDPTSRANRAIVDAFERENPGIELQGAQGLQISGPAAESSLLLAFAGGSAPDVVYVNFRNSASYISQGFLSPLDDFLQRDPQEFTRLKPEIRKVLQDTGQGHIYSMPYAQFVQAVYYRKDLFLKAGLDPNKPPTTWDEFYADAQKMTDQNKGIWGFEFGTDPDASAYWWVNFLWQAGGEVIQRNKDGRWEAAFDSPAGVEALEFYKKLMKDPWRGPDGKTYLGVAQHSSTMGLDRAQGKVGMWFAYQSNVIANIADATAMNPSLIGIAPMPKGPTGITANELNASMWGMSSQIRDPRIKEAAWKFIKFMGSDEADRIRTKAFVEAGLGDTVNPESLEKYGYGDYTTRESRVWLQTNKTLFLHGHPEPYAENMSQIYVLLGIPLSEIEHDPTADPHRLLAAAATEVNTKLTGYVPPGEMQTRRRGAAVIFTLVMCAICVAIGFQIRTLLRDRARRRAEMRFAEKPSGLTLRGHLAAWLFMIPAVLSILVWSYYPLQQGLVIAFQHYRLLGNATYVGLDNFIDVFHQPSFWKGVINSLIFTVYSLTLGFLLPVFLALGLSAIPRGTVIFRILYYLPAVTSGLAITFMWKIFEDGTPNGLFNTLIHHATGGHIGPIIIPPINWLQDPRWALFAVVLPSIWAGAGPGSIIYLAALKSIPDELYEAADLDGASVMTKVWRIALPSLKPLILINLIGATIGAFQATSNIFAMTGGGPGYATQTLGLEIWMNAFMYLKFGYATAAAWIMGCMLVGFTLFQLRTMRNLKFSAAGA